MTKAEQRASALASRAAMSREARAAASAAICARLMEQPALLGAHVVFSYLATEEEADLSALHDALCARGVTVAFPVTAHGGMMEAYAPGEGDPLAASAYGIREPSPRLSRLVGPEEIDVVLAPCVAFDAECRRLGHGGGYYDRYLARCPQAAVFAAAFEAQKLGRVTEEEFDLPVDAVVTESGVYMRGTEG